MVPYVSICTKNVWGERESADGDDEDDILLM